MRLFKRKEKPPLPFPLVKVTKKPHVWVRNKVHMVATATVGTYLGVLFIAGLYYLLTQTTDFMDNAWHSFVPDDNLRHDIRNVGEGLLGGVIAQGFIWNHWKPKKAKLWDKLEIKLGLPNYHDHKDIGLPTLILTPLLVCLYAIPGFLLGRWMVNEISFLYEQSQVLNMTLGDVAPSLDQRMRENMTADWPQKLMGFGAAFLFGRHVAKGVYDDVQGWFAANRIMRENEKTNVLDITTWTLWQKFRKMTFRLLPPGYQARVNYMREQGIDENMKEKWQAKMLKWGMLVALPVTAFGYYILNFKVYGL